MGDLVATQGAGRDEGAVKNLEAEARRLYDACPTVKPTWDQLGEVTRSVWIDKAKEKLNEQETLLQQELPEPS